MTEPADEPGYIAHSRQIPGGVTLRLETEVASIDARGHSVSLPDGKNLPFDKLLLATGAEPIRLDIPGANAPHVFVLRSLADSRAIIERAKSAKRAVVLGASFIGLEAAAALRARGIDVHVAAPERAPLERVFGSEMAQFVRLLHEEHGVTFHMEQKATAIDSAGAGTPAIGASRIGTRSLKRVQNCLVRSWISFMAACSRVSCPDNSRLAAAAPQAKSSSSKRSKSICHL